MSDPVRHAFPRRAPKSELATPTWAARPDSGIRAIVVGRPAPAPSVPPEPRVSLAPEPPRAPSIAPPNPPRSITPPEPPRSITPPEPPPATTPDPELEKALVLAAQALERARPEVLASVESDLLALAVDIASVLVEDELSRRPELHRALVRAALDGIEPGPGVRVRASRVTYEALLEAFDQASVDAGRGRVPVERDDTLEGAGAVVDVKGASIDGRVAPRLAALRAALEEARRQKRAA